MLGDPTRTALYAGLVETILYADGIYMPAWIPARYEDLGVRCAHALQDNLTLPPMMMVYSGYNWCYGSQYQLGGMITDWEVRLHQPAFTWGDTLYNGYRVYTFGGLLPASGPFYQVDFGRPGWRPQLPQVWGPGVPAPTRR